MSKVGLTNRYDWLDWSATDDFSRVAVLQQLLPLVQHTNETVAIAALKCFRVGKLSGEFIRSHADEFLAVANEGRSIPRRLAAIAALSDTRLTSVSNALARLQEIRLGKHVDPPVLHRLQR